MPYYLNATHTTVIRHIGTGIDNFIAFKSRTRKQPELCDAIYETPSISTVF